MRPILTILIALTTLVVGVPAHAVLCDAVFRASSCPSAQCNEAVSCRQKMLEEWTPERCMKNPANAQEEIASACEKCNRVCGSPTAWMSGSWSGSGYQENAKSSWTMRLVIRQDNYSIEYPSLSCGGYWTLNNTGQGVASFSEHITYGKDKCIDGGSVTIGDLGGGHMQYRWSSSDDTATGNLTREK